MKLSKLQTEEVLKQFLSKENGLNEVLEIFMNSLMYSERDVFLKSQDGDNKGNGYREGQVYGRGRQLQLRIPRDRMGQFYPVLLALLRDQDSQLHDLSFMLYSKVSLLPTPSCKLIHPGIYLPYAKIPET